jgi:hypothetical protein
MKTMNMPDHFGTNSALVEFLAGRLGAPECWPDDCKVKATVTRGAELNIERRVERQHRGRSRTHTLASHRCRHLINQKRPT